MEEKTSTHPVYRENQFEHSISYDQDGARREFALTHLPGSAQPILTSAIVSPGGELLASIAMTLEEVKLRYDWITQLKEAGMLELPGNH